MNGKELTYWIGSWTLYDIALHSRLSFCVHVDIVYGEMDQYIIYGSLA